ncbi:acyl-CoA dehydrogenase family protein [Nocardioides campestrisoli]|uniref:acyl-CoA dehydrogenase family protein n=1 Tax=Nocardioides campestrisoli TaxID=2736757 RepID=UPI0015E6F15C|nr:acyl-CoA dehydrogenase family protein [Nocardioides campestrisoli]
MDFTHDDEQVALRDAVRALLTKKYGDFEERRRTVRAEPGFDETLWRQLAEMGVLGLAFDEEYGGMGAGPVEIGLVAEEIGRVLAPEPFLAAVVLGGGAVAAAGTETQRAELIAALASGELRLALAHHDGGTPTRAEGSGDAWTLTGVKEPVLSGDAERLVVSAELPEGGTGLFLVDGDAVTRTTSRAYDGSRVSRVELDRTAATPLGEPGVDASAALASVLDLGRIAACHEALGGMAVALETTTAYLKSRKQFGVPLNTFQALNFRAADMYVSLELTRSTVAWATMVVASGADPALTHEAVTRAALQTSRAGRHVGQEAVQLHGGIGMTAEYLVGNITAHLTALDHLLGDGRRHLTELAAGVDGYPGLDPLAPTMRSASSA